MWRYKKYYIPDVRHKEITMHHVEDDPEEAGRVLGVCHMADCDDVTCDDCILYRGNDKILTEYLTGDYHLVTLFLTEE